MSEVLWKPDAARLEASRMSAFMRFIEQRESVPIPDYRTFDPASLKRERTHPAIPFESASQLDLAGNLTESFGAELIALANTLDFDHLNTYYGWSSCPN